MKTVNQYLEEKQFPIKEIRKVKGKEFIPIEDDYYDDGNSLSRQYICSSDELILGKYQQWKVPIYLMVWPLDAIPKQEEPIQIKKDPIRKYNLSYYAQFPIVQKTYEVTDSGWRLKEASGTYHLEKSNINEEKFNELRKEGYLPSEAEWRYEQEYDAQASQNKEKILLLREEVWSSLQEEAEEEELSISKCAGAAYKLYEETNKENNQMIKMFELHNMGGTCKEMTFCLTEIRDQYSSVQEYLKAFHEKGISQGTLCRFVTMMAELT